MTLILYGYRYSVYTRIPKMVFAEKGRTFDYCEIDPFGPLPEDYRRIHPFGRVPALVHADFILYEASAITLYLDQIFETPSLQPDTAVERARMQQIVAVTDNYGYWPMVRQVFARRVFGPAMGEPLDREALDDGLAGSRTALAAIEALTAERPFLVGDRLTLADLHLAPMIAALIAAPEGSDLLSGFPKLSAWWSAMSVRPSLTTTETGLPGNSEAQ